MNDALIETRDLDRTYTMGDSEVRVLRGVNLKVGEGEFVALMGPSGSGKSTLMHILGCLDRPNSGSYLLDGQDVSRMSDDQRAAIRNRRIGFVFQSFNLLPRLSALENVALPMFYLRDDRNWRERAAAALARVGLKHRLEHRPVELSGGERQRVAIARALVNNPAVILADEPTGNLDRARGQEIMNLLCELNRDGRTLVMVTHDAASAGFAGRVVVMTDGQIVTEESHVIS